MKRRLKGLKPLLPILGPNAALQRSYEVFRNTDSWRAWTKSAEWKRLRWQCLVRDKFICRLCGTMIIDTSQAVADHIIAHRGDERLFWDESNLQCLCVACHDNAKRREDIAQKRES